MKHHEPLFFLFLQKQPSHRQQCRVLHILEETNKEAQKLCCKAF